MCIICGKIEHETYELVEKALKSRKKKKKELPRFKSLAQLEASFKKEFAETIADTSIEITKVIS